MALEQIITDRDGTITPERHRRLADQPHIQLVAPRDDNPGRELSQ